MQSTLQIQPVSEVWKDVPQYEGLYQVSNLGRVMTLRRGRLLSPWITQKGYHHIALCKDGDRNPQGIHRLVAQAFIPNPENKPEVNHKDGVKGNCYVDNLEWATTSENNIHAIRTGLRIQPRNNWRSVPVIQLTLEGEFVKEWPSIHEVSRSMGMLAGSLSNCLNKRTATCYGFKWAYKRDHVESLGG